MCKWVEITAGFHYGPTATPSPTQIKGISVRFLMNNINQRNHLIASRYSIPLDFLISAIRKSNKGIDWKHWNAQKTLDRDNNCNNNNLMQILFSHMTFPPKNRNQIHLIFISYRCVHAPSSPSIFAAIPLKIIIIHSEHFCWSSIYSVAFYFVESSNDTGYTYRKR